MTFEKLKLLLWLFKTDFFISSFTFGGGYVVLPMIRKYFIEQKHLFSEDELMDMSAVAQSSPGAIAINLAVLCGKKWPAGRYFRCRNCSRFTAPAYSFRRFRLLPELNRQSGGCRRFKGNGSRRGRPDCRRGLVHEPHDCQKKGNAAHFNDSCRFYR